MSSRIVRYEHTPSRAVDMVQALGYARERSRPGTSGIIRHVAELLPVMGLYYSGQPDAFANRIVNVSTRSSGPTGTNPAWNAHEWDVES